MADASTWQPVEGGCPCKTIRYRMDKPPLVVHCCHCTWCQKESSSAFALNAMIEAEYVALLSKEKTVVVSTPSESGEGQQMHRCPVCQFVVWSNYGDDGDSMRWVRVSTLDDPSRTPPSVHIFTSTKMPWVVLGDAIPVKEEYYAREDIWSKTSLERLSEYRSRSSE